jgi:hypothetical protein
MSTASDEISAGPCLRHQAGIDQFLEMKRQRRGWNAKTFRHYARSQASRASNDQGAKNLQAMRLAQRSKRPDDVIFFLVSSILEIS